MDEISNVFLKNIIDIPKAFSEPPEALDFVVDGFLAGTVGTLFSTGATGKSFLSLQLAIDIAAGTDNLLLGVKAQGKVLYLAAEDPPNIIKKRLYDIGKLLNLNVLKKASKNLRIAAVSGENIKIAAKNSGDTALKSIIEACGSDTRIIIIDTISRFHSLDENSNSDMSTLIQKLEYLALQTKSAVLFLHHISKSTALSQLGDTAQAARGASALVDNSRFGATLTTMNSKEAAQYDIDESQRRNYIRYSVVKNNYAAPVEDIWFKRLVGGVLAPVEIQKIQKIEKQAKESNKVEFNKWEDFF